MERFFSTCIAVAAMIAAGSLFYHFVFFLPMAHEQDQRRAEQARVTEFQRTSAREMVKVRCRAAARKAYESTRERACADAAVLSKRRHEQCVQDALLAGEPSRKSECDAALMRQAEQCLMTPSSVALLEAAYEKTEADCQKTGSL